MVDLSMAFCMFTRPGSTLGTDHGTTPLHMAAFAGHLEVVRCLALWFCERFTGLNFTWHGIVGFTVI